MRELIRAKLELKGQNDKFRGGRFTAQDSPNEMTVTNRRLREIYSEDLQRKGAMRDVCVYVKVQERDAY
jgi:hypothetical protein